MILDWSRPVQRPLGAAGSASEMSTRAGVHFITIATDDNAFLRRFLSTCTHWGIDPTLLGQGARLSGWGVKVDLIREHLSKLRADDLFVYTDAYDVIVIGSPEELRDKLLRIAHPLVVSIEANFFANSTRAGPGMWLRCSQRCSDDRP